MKNFDVIRQGEILQINTDITKLQDTLKCLQSQVVILNHTIENGLSEVDKKLALQTREIRESGIK